MMFVSLAVVFLLVLGTLADDFCDPVQLDKCGVILHSFFINPSLFPETDEELHELCLTLESGETCLTDYLDNCASHLELSDRFVSMLKDTNKIAVNGLCSINGGPMYGIKLLHHSACFKEHVPDVPCTRELVQRLESTINLDPPSKRAEAACCSLSAFYTCNHNMSANACGEDPAHVVHSIFQDLSAILLETCTPFFDRPEHCDLSILRGIPGPDDHQVRSILPSIIDLSPIIL